VAGARRTGAAVVEDVALDVAGADPVEAYVVQPADGAVRAGVLWLHWLGEHHNDRTQLLPEAVALAANGVRSVLPAGRFPWLVPPTDAEADAAAIELEGRRIERAFRELAAGLPKQLPIALVGHDFGAMHGLGFMAREPRLRAAVLIAGVPRWADWFLPFWPIAGDPIEYRRRLAPFDPITAIAATKADLLLQFSRRDFYIAPMTARELARAAGRDVGLEWYEADHAMRSAKARAARTAFLGKVLLLP
jgi:pimeloyl-ACP methyl ester carboxylesterase